MVNPLVVSPEAEAELVEAYPQVHKTVRQILVRRFPYVICYTFAGGVIHILAVFHGHRDPDEWKRRLP